MESEQEFYLGRIQNLFQGNSDVAEFLVSFYGFSDSGNQMPLEVLYNEILAVFEPASLDDEVHVWISPENSYSGKNERLYVGSVGLVPDDIVAKKVLVRNN